MSTSPARLAANRLNARKSTGPRTVEGKQRSAQNARTHGLTALTLPDSASRNDRFQALVTALEKRYAPADAFEHDLLDRLIVARWNLFVAERLIAGYVDLAEEEPGADLPTDPESLRTRRLATAFINDAGTNAFSKMLRYRDSSQRQYDRLRKELEALRETKPTEGESLTDQPITVTAVAPRPPVIPVHSDEPPSNPRPLASSAGHQYLRP